MCEENLIGCANKISNFGHNRQNLSDFDVDLPTI
jgi:hypothetical protein